MTDLDATSPETVRGDRGAVLEATEEIDGPALFTILERPMAVKTLRALFVGDPPLTAKQICDRADFGRTSFAREKDLLLDASLILTAGKRGNAPLYRLNTAHPVVQCLAMASEVFTHGSTVVHLDERFIKAPIADVVEETVEDLNLDDPGAELVAAAVRERIDAEWVRPETVEPYLN